jgi:imidazoleglycerol-phosphate dehydratase
MTMQARTAKIERKTHETDIVLELNLDGTGRFTIDSGIGFLDHMLTHIAKHGHIDLKVKARGDLHVDPHHTVEDIAICLGLAISEAIGDKKGITRYGSASVPMEDALANVAIDLSGRPYCVYNVKYPSEKIGDFDVECLEEFLRSLANHAKLNLHVNVAYGINSHHIAEAICKAIGRSLATAVAISGGDIPSTKGVL